MDGFSGKGMKVIVVVSGTRLDTSGDYSNDIVHKAHSAFVTESA